MLTLAITAIPNSNRIQKLTQFTTGKKFIMNTTSKLSKQQKKIVISILLALTALGLAYAPIRRLKQRFFIPQERNIVIPQGKF